MPSAKYVALCAAAIAREAAELEAAHKAAIQEDERRWRESVHRKAYEAALPILAEWFPGVEWDWFQMGDYNNDTILVDRSEPWPPSFRLMVIRYLLDMNEPEAGYKVEIKVGDYRQDSSLPGYSYFEGSKVTSPADVGRYLEGKE